MNPVSSSASCSCVAWLSEQVASAQDFVMHVVSHTMSLYYLVTDADLKRKQIRHLNAAIFELSKQEELSFAACEALEECIPGYEPPHYPVEGEGIRSKEEVLLSQQGLLGVNERFNQTRNQLLTALKTARVSRLFSSKEDRLEDLVSTKSELLRLHDIRRSQFVPGKRPNANVLLELREANPEWQKPNSAMKNIPPYLFYYSHPKDSTKDSHEISPSPDGSKELWCNGNSKWYRVLRFISDTKLKPLHTMSSDALKTLSITLFATFDGQKESIKRLDDVPLFKHSSKFSTLAAQYKQQGLHDGAHLLQSLDRKESRWNEFDKAVPYVTTEEWNVLKEVAYVAPFPIDESIDAFFHRLKDHLCNEKLHPFQVAAFIHFGLTSIRPFPHSNGRMARLFMNIYLMQKGYLPLVVTQEAAYLALFQSPNYERAFGDYLDNFQKKYMEFKLPTELHVAEWKPADAEHKQEPYVVIDG
jgi:hypothetical protein